MGTSIPTLSCCKLHATAFEVVTLNRYFIGLFTLIHGLLSFNELRLGACHQLTSARPAALSVMSAGASRVRNMQLQLVSIALLCFAVQPSAAHRQLAQEQVTPAGAGADAQPITALAEPDIQDPVALAAATLATPTPFDPEANPPPGARPGFETPDRVPGPPHADPSGQGMYKGHYRCVGATCTSPASHE